MSLPVPNLDDREFQDLVDEAKRMIPSLVPEWTNHNVADPGVALIELFAWMSEQVIYRLNQVPEKLYVEFLNLLGTGPFPASAARVPLTFWLSGLPAEPVRIPAGTEVTNAGGGVVFATLDDLVVHQPSLAGALTSQGEGSYVDVSDQLAYERDDVVCFTSDPVAPDDALLFGFATSLAGQMVELRIEASARGIGVDPANPPIVWEVWDGEHWIGTDVLVDTTGGLNRTGRVRLVVPPVHESLVLNGERLFWLRVRLRRTPPGAPTYTTSPRLGAVTVASQGGSVMAEHARTVTDEVLGTSDGTAAQQFGMANRPVLPRREGEHVVVTLDGVSEDWEEVADFGASVAGDRHVRIDEALGIVEFGPHVRYPDGTVVEHGAVPPYGSLVSISQYRTGGGAGGNVGARTLTQLRSAIPYVAEVSNLVPSTGGVDPESIDEVKVRGPRSLRTGRRAVTVSDYEQLTLDSTSRVARALCLPAYEPDEPIRVLVVPANDRDPLTLELDDFVLDDDLYTTVSDYLEARRTLGARVRVTAPYFQGVSVIARVRAVVGRSPASVKDRVERAVAAYLSPLPGGTRTEGWGFGEPVSTAGLTSMIENVVGVSSVDEVMLFEYDLRNGRRLGDPTDVIPLDEDALVLSGRTQVVVR